MISQNFRKKIQWRTKKQMMLRLWRTDNMHWGYWLACLSSILTADCANHWKEDRKNWNWKRNDSWYQMLYTHDFPRCICVSARKPLRSRKIFKMNEIFEWYPSLTILVAPCRRYYSTNYTHAEEKKHFTTSSFRWYTHELRMNNTFYAGLAQATTLSGIEWERDALTPCVWN